MYQNNNKSLIVCTVIAFILAIIALVLILTNKCNCNRERYDKDWCDCNNIKCSATTECISDYPCSIDTDCSGTEKCQNRSNYCTDNKTCHNPTCAPKCKPNEKRDKDNKCIPCDTSLIDICGVCEGTGAGECKACGVKKDMCGVCGGEGPNLECKDIADECGWGKMSSDPDDNPCYNCSHPAVDGQVVKGFCVRKCRTGDEIRNKNGDCIPCKDGVLDISGICVDPKTGFPLFLMRKFDNGGNFCDKFEESGCCKGYTQDCEKICGGKAQMCSTVGSAKKTCCHFGCKTGGLPVGGGCKTGNIDRLLNK